MKYNNNLWRVSNPPKVWYSIFYKNKFKIMVQMNPNNLWRVSNPPKVWYARFYKIK
jgi:hypothetical protein